MASDDITYKHTCRCTNIITNEGTLWEKKTKKTGDQFYGTVSVRTAPVRVSNEYSREGQTGNSRPWVQITNSHHRWCSAAVHP